MIFIALDAFSASKQILKAIKLELLQSTLMIHQKDSMTKMRRQSLEHIKNNTTRWANKIPALLSVCINIGFLLIVQAVSLHY